MKVRYLVMFNVMLFICASFISVDALSLEKPIFKYEPNEWFMSLMLMFELYFVIGSALILLVSFGRLLIKLKMKMIGRIIISLTAIPLLILLFFFARASLGSTLVHIVVVTLFIYTAKKAWNYEYDNNND